MSANIHPAALVEPGANIHPEATIGAFAYIGPDVTMGAGCVVHHHATVEGWTEMGCANEVYPYAMIGGKTHDLKHRGGKPRLRIGDRNVFREYATVHLATNDGEYTVIGSDNVILAYSHIAHDCIVGNHLVMSSHAALGGHVQVQDHVNVGWGCGVHQFCRLGAHAMLGACSKVVQDVPPLMIADGNPAEIRTINKIGLERSGRSAEDLAVARRIFKTLYRSGLNHAQALEQLRADPQAGHPLMGLVLDFVAASERGIV